MGIVKIKASIEVTIEEIVDDVLWNEATPEQREVWIKGRLEDSKETAVEYLKIDHEHVPTVQEPKEECNCYYTKFCKSTMLKSNEYCRDTKR